MAPHRYPFLLIDPPAGAPASPERPPEVTVRLTANATLLRGEGPLSLFLLLEIAAQAALRLAGEPAAGAPAGEEKVLLAGVEEMSFAAGAETRPPQPGDELVLRARPEARFAKLTKLRVEIDRDGARLAEAVLLLASA